MSDGEAKQGTIVAEEAMDFKTEYQAPRQLPVAGVGSADVIARNGAMAISATDGIITAQRVAKPRNMAQILLNLKALAQASNGKYAYGWDVKNKDGTKSRVAGTSIKGAMAVAREFGNCQIDVRVIAEKEHWLFQAAFVDLETGFKTVRLFRQRNSQGIGSRYDAERALDLVFQIGQSKAIRNVVVNALGDICEYVREEAESGLYDKIKASPEKACEAIKKKIAAAGINLKHVEAAYGRTADKWTVPDMVKIYTETQSVEDGMMNAEDVFPDPAAVNTATNSNPEQKSPLKPKQQADPAPAAPTPLVPSGEPAADSPKGEDTTGPADPPAEKPTQDAPPATTPAAPRRPAKRPAAGGGMFKDEE